jgi:hypothetical protein
MDSVGFIMKSGLMGAFVQKLIARDQSTQCKMSKYDTLNSPVIVNETINRRYRKSCIAMRDDHNE